MVFRVFRVGKWNAFPVRRRSSRRLTSTHVVALDSNPGQIGAFLRRLFAQTIAQHAFNR